MLKNKTLDIINIVGLIISAILVIHAAIYVSFANSTVTTYEMGDSAICSMIVEQKEGKIWSELSHGFRYGLEYDGIIDNQSNSNVSDWTVEITIPEGCHIDSSWNGVYVYEGNKITITPVDYNYTVLPKDKETFGFILYSDESDNIFDYSFRFRYENMRITDLIGFWIAMVVFGMLVIVDVTSIFYERKTSDMEKQRNRYRQIVNESFVAFVSMIDAKDPYTKGHSLRVAIYSRELARRMGMDEELVKDIFYVALLHDIGKIGIADSILKKQGKLTAEERAEICNHVKYGGEILKEYSAIENVSAGARYHHEWYNGKGYLEGLSGEDIPIFARIIGIADAFDAMSSSRCYREKMEIEEICAELKRCSGTQFDPNIVPHMLDMINEKLAPVELTESGANLKNLLEENGR